MTTTLDDLFDEVNRRAADLKAQGKPYYWKPKGSHRRNKPKPYRRAKCHSVLTMSEDLVERECAWGYCVNQICPTCHKIIWGMGPVACPCDHSNGWSSPYVEGQAKPHPPVKAVGRHGGRIQAARRKAKEREAWLIRWS